jgi:ABC-type transport system involved in multi-copper enzyme maturation permease subunit
MLRLLQRDLRLHTLLLATPLAITALLAYYLPAADAGGRVALGGLAFFLPLLLPLGFHLREQSEGTLGDLAALPVTRIQIVGLRFLEALVLPLGAVLLLFLAAATLKATTLRPGLPLRGFPVAFLSHPLGLAWAFFLVFAYPLPATLRWGGKGLGLAAAIPLGGLFALGQVGIRMTHGAGWIIGALSALGRWDSLHPGQEALLLAGLLGLSFFLSVKAFAAKDL